MTLPTWNDYQKLDAEAYSRQIARDLVDGVNRLDFDVAAFADEITRKTHRSIQQSIFRAVVGLITAWAEAYKTNAFDLRNEDTCYHSAMIVATFGKDFHAGRH